MRRLNKRSGRLDRTALLSRHSVVAASRVGSEWAGSDGGRWCFGRFNQSNSRLATVPAVLCACVCVCASHFLGPCVTHLLERASRSGAGWAARCAALLLLKQHVIVSSLGRLPAPPAPVAGVPWLVRSPPGRLGTPTQRPQIGAKAGETCWGKSLEALARCTVSQLGLSPAARSAAHPSILAFHIPHSTFHLGAAWRRPVDRIRPDPFLVLRPRPQPAERRRNGARQPRSAVKKRERKEDGSGQGHLADRVAAATVAAVAVQHGRGQRRKDHLPRPRRRRRRRRLTGPPALRPRAAPRHADPGQRDRPDAAGRAVPDGSPPPGEDDLVPAGQAHSTPALRGARLLAGNSTSPLSPSLPLALPENFF